MHRSIASPACFFFALALSAQQPLPYQNPALTPEVRAHDLVSRMTLDEKVEQMSSAAAAIPRLGVPAYNYWNEALHGVARAGYATMFPQAIGMAATWDPPLLRQVGDVISTEARAKNNDALAHGNHQIYYGLNFWSPNINIFRDPRWGRGQETYGEDPYLTGQLGASFIAGLQGNDPHYYKVIGTPKHFAVHSGPENVRHKFNVEPSAHDLWDTYLPQFRTAIVDARAGSLMCAYNRVDGAPACGSKMLLQTILRDDWKFKGFVTSDCGAIDDFFEPYGHRTEPDAEHADRDALLAGTDVSCGSTYKKLGAAVQQGLVSVSEIDRSLERLMEARMRLGLFDAGADVPYAQIPFSAIHTAADVALTRHTAEESMVLLKNDGILPLQVGRYRTVAVIGPNAANLQSLEGNYNGTPHDPVLPVDALKLAMSASQIVYAQGAPFVDGFGLPVPRTMLRVARDVPEAGLKAVYYGTPDFTGNPVRTVVDAQISFNWDDVRPLPGPPDAGFSVRWSGQLQAPHAGTYRFELKAGPCAGCAAEQSFRVLVDGKEVVASVPPRPADPRVPVVIDGFTGIPVDAQQQPPAHFEVSFTEGQQHALQVDFARMSGVRGTGITLNWTPTPDVLLPAAVQAAKQADLVVAMLGLSPDLEGEEMPVKLEGFEGGDRTSINLPASQERLLQQLVATGKPVVVVLLNGSALAVNYADAHANAVLEAWYPGEAGGAALADTLLGKNNPSGRLPLTFYAAESDLPPFADYSMKNRTYRYFTGKPLYDFGFGLSYTRFVYSGLKLPSAPLKAGDALVVEADVKNAGARAGDEVAELYLVPPAEGNSGLSPRLQLEGVQRVHLMPGETRHLQFHLDPRQLSEVDANGNRTVQAGSYRVSVGGSQPGDARVGTGVQSGTLQITGSAALPH